MSAGTDWLEAQAEGLGREKAAGGVTTALLWLGGAGALGLGAALAVGGHVSPDAGWIATKLSRIGVSAGPVLACGALFIGMAWLGRLLRKQSGQLSMSLVHGQVLARLAKDFTGLRENIARVQLEFADIQQANRQLLNLVRQQAQAGAENEPTKDAMFRLAASMDQLGARLETRVRALFDGLEKRVDGFDRRLEETSNVQRTELGRLEERLTIAATLAQSTSSEIPYVDGAPKRSSEDTTDAGGPPRASDHDEPTPVDEPVVELKPQEEWLDIQVELEEQDCTLESTPGLCDGADDANDAPATNDNWFAEATRRSGLDDGFDEELDDDLLDDGEPRRLSPAECAAVDQDEMLEQLDSLFGEDDDVTEALEKVRRRRGE